jgi:DNA-binding CsgD family transcriptional regulator
MDLNNKAVPSFMGMDSEEIKTIEYIAEGLTCAEIGLKLKVKTSRIDNIRKNLISKTRSKNTASLISFAYKYGVLKL